MRGPGCSAVLRLLIDTGIRAAELTGLTLGDLDFDDDTATVLGKGRRARSVPLGAKTVDALRGQSLPVRQAAAADGRGGGHTLGVHPPQPCPTTRSG